MKLISIIFQAYIPAELGKPLIDYFKDNPSFSPNLLSNYNEFRSNLLGTQTQGMKWIPEPITGALASRYFSTDDSNFHSGKHKGHTARLKLEGTIDLSKVGKFSLFDISTMFYDKHNGRLSKDTQHSDESHCVAASIGYDHYSRIGNIAIPTGKPKGFFEKSKPQRSKELQLNVQLKNDITGQYFAKKGTSLTSLYDTTTIKVSGSAGYPYLEPLSPNIDLSLKIKLVKTGSNVLITIEGEHNKFPAYELVINNNVMYNYNPAKHGYKGPSPINLSQSATFTKKYLVKI